MMCFIISKGDRNYKLTFVEAEGQGKVVPKYGLYFKGKEGSFSYIRPSTIRRIHINTLEHIITATLNRLKMEK